VFSYDLALNHNTSVTNGQTDSQTTITHTTRPLLNYGRLKIKCRRRILSRTNNR